MQETIVALINDLNRLIWFFKTHIWFYMHDNISLFIAVVQAGGFKAASKLLHIPASTIGRRIKQLENEFGCKLLSRNSHTFEMTREGRKLYQSAGFHVNALDSIANELRQDIAGEVGLIKLLAPTNLMASHLQKILAQFLIAHPNIQLELELSNTLARFHATNADLAIRVGRQADSDLTQYKLGTIQTFLVASPGYLQSSTALVEPKALEQHQLIVVSPLPSWLLFDNLDSSVQFTFKPATQRVLVNDLNVAKQFAVDGLGIALLPQTEVKQELLSGDLVRALPDWHGVERDVYAVWYRRQLLSTRAAKLIDYLQSHANF